MAKLGRPKQVQPQPTQEVEAGTVQDDRPQQAATIDAAVVGHAALGEAVQRLEELEKSLRAVQARLGEAGPYYGLLADATIVRYAQEKAMISPFVDHLVREENGEPVISYGLSSYGYDLRLASPVAILQSAAAVVDPKAAVQTLQLAYRQPTPESRGVVLPAGGSALVHTLEYLRLPPNVLGVITGKSTYARSGLVLVGTVAEPGWEGQLTLLVVNTAPRPLRIYPGEGICQVLFFEAQPCKVTYADRSGKYQAQRGIMPAQVS